MQKGSHKSCLPCKNGGKSTKCIQSPKKDIDLPSSYILCYSVLAHSQSIFKAFFKAKKKLLDSQLLDFSKNRCVQAPFSFYFPVGYILGHLGLFG